jgi:hypothetical protein
LVQFFLPYTHYSTKSWKRTLDARTASTGIEPGPPKVQYKHPPSTNRGTMTWRPRNPKTTNLYYDINITSPKPKTPNPIPKSACNIIRWSPRTTLTHNIKIWQITNNSQTVPQKYKNGSIYTHVAYKRVLQTSISKIHMLPYV